MKKIFILFFFIFASFYVYANDITGVFFTSLLYNNSFDNQTRYLYGGGFTASASTTGCIYDGTVTNYAPMSFTEYTQPTSSFAFGYNTTSNCTGDYINKIGKTNLPQAKNGVLILRYNVSVLNDSALNNEYIAIHLTGKNYSSSGMLSSMYYFWNQYFHDRTILGSYLGGIEYCSSNLPLNKTNFFGTVTLKIDFGHQIYDFYFNDTLSNCTGKTLYSPASSIVNLTWLTLETRIDAGTNPHNYNALIDDIQYGQGTTLTNETTTNGTSGYCIDTDGVNYLDPSYVIDNGTVKYDFCQDGTNLIEYYCSGDQSENITYDCTGLGNGYYCYAGECVYQTSFSNCYTGYPMLFCDDFNYNQSIYLNGWQPMTLGGGILTSLAPYNNTLVLNNTIVQDAMQETGSFITNYTTSSSTTVIESYNSPVFSSEFSLTIRNTSTSVTDITDCFRYVTYDLADDGVYDIAFCPNASVYRYTNTSIYTNVCNGCMQQNTKYSIKINSFFAQRFNFDFNSTVSSDYYEIIIDNTKYTVTGFINNQAYNIQEYNLLQIETSSVVVDDYYVMVGTDKTYDTSNNFYNQIFTETYVNESLGTGAGDMATEIGTLWSEMGLKSATSRSIAALALMLLLALVIWGLSVTHGYQLSPFTLLILEFFFMILLVYINLLPLWIPIVLSLIAAGLGTMAAIKNQTGGG